MTERKFTPPTSFPAEYAMNDVDGTRVTLIGEGVGEFPYVGQDEDGYWRIFRRDGRNSTCAQYGLYDLPKTNVQWANDYEEIFGCTWHDSREEADANAMWDCIAVIRREWTEGELPKYFAEESRMSDPKPKRLVTWVHWDTTCGLFEETLRQAKAVQNGHGGCIYRIERDEDGSNPTIELVEVGGKDE